MLAKDTKINTLIIQRDFIESRLRCIGEDGDSSYRYAGYIYPENRKYFEEEGYDITTITSIEALQITQGLPLNIFTPSDEITLTEEEELISETIAIEIANASGNIDTILKYSVSSKSVEECTEDNCTETEEDVVEEEIKEEIIYE